MKTKRNQKLKNRTNKTVRAISLEPGFRPRKSDFKYHPCIHLFSLEAHKQENLLQPKTVQMSIIRGWVSKLWCAILKHLQPLKIIRLIC